MTLALTLTFVVLAALTVLALLWSRWPGWLKGLLVTGVAVFYFWADGVVHDLAGWPTTDALPERFVLLAAVIEEPTNKGPGALFIWVQALQDGKPVRQPRGYQLPYAKDLHALLNEGIKKSRQGVTQMGQAEPKAGRKGLNWLRPGSDEQVVKIRDLPAPQLPEK
ncbi:hypothetical protein [Sphaerotilus mobilis]|jgi:hypothetical protein|uniref:Uncharacterized protein n=1 Tax=Sphaerotilus mobilis TaxID=47994 RepID=A0A4Q7LRI7_9BURK|nr:hypothetical protein [Sphaerotilus mobilis]RZS56842.1 hypothetical protein EV685_1397 [Sphaerotilus mobilis]